MKKIISLLTISIAGIFFANTSNAGGSSALYSDVQVDLTCSGSDCGTTTLANSNTTRKLAVNSQGHIYAVFYGQNGIWVSKSTNRGQSFSDSTMVSATNAQPEIGTSADGTAYVIWSESGSYVISKSADGADTWSNPITVGVASGPQAHMAVDGDYIYVVGQQGTTLYYSSDAGQTWSTTVVGSSQVFADVHVDPITHYVYVFTDNPSVFWYVSTDRGVTLSSQKTTGKSVFFSVGALTSTGSSKYFYMAGSGTNLERINLSDESVQTTTVSASDGSTTRSLAADSCGNVVSGHKSGADLYFQYSSDSGSSFSAQQLVIASADRANASINPTNGDLIFLYEKSGDIFLTTYAGLFVNGSNCYAATISNTAIEFTAPGQTPSITLTNTSNSPLSVDNISITGNVFTVSHNCGSFIPANGSCTVLINGSSQGNETLNITLNGTQRTIPVTLGATAAARPPEESTPPVAAPVQENNNSITEEVIAIEETNLEVVVPNNKIVRNDKLENKKDSLPNTGSESSGILIFSLILILLGSIFVAGKKISKPLL